MVLCYLEEVLDRSWMYFRCTGHITNTHSNTQHLEQNTIDNDRLVTIVALATTTPGLEQCRKPAPTLFWKMEPTISHTSGYEPWPIARGFCERPNTFHFTFLYAFKMCYQFSSIFLRIFNASLPFKDIVHCSRRSLFLGFISPPKKKKEVWPYPSAPGTSARMWVTCLDGRLCCFTLILSGRGFPQLTTITLQGIKGGFTGLLSTRVRFTPRRSVKITDVLSKHLFFWPSDTERKWSSNADSCRTLTKRGKVGGFGSFRTAVSQNTPKNSHSHFVAPWPKIVKQFSQI